MFNIFAKKRLVDYYCLTSIEEQWKISSQLVSGCMEYLNNRQFSFSNFFSGTEKNKYYKGKIADLFKLKTTDLAYLCIYNNENYEIANVKLNWIVGPPSFIYIELDEDYAFEFKDFIIFVKDFFRIDYGYVYKGTAGEKTESYLFGQREKVKYLKDVSRNSEFDYELWQKNRLKINEGKIRAVFRLNLLNSAQTYNRCRSNGSLLDLIHSSQQFGVIEELYEGHFFWKVEVNQLEKVREILKDEEFLS